MCRHDKFTFPTAVKHVGIYQPTGKLDMHWVMREVYLKLLLQLCDKILEYKKFGQDMLTCEDCSSRKVREQILVLLEILKGFYNAFNMGAPHKGWARERGGRGSSRSSKWESPT